MYLTNPENIRIEDPNVTEGISLFIMIGLRSVIPYVGHRAWKMILINDLMI